MKRTFTLCAALFIGAVAMAQSTVTFKVDITNYVAGGAVIDPTGIRVAGTFSTNGGTVTAGAMADWSPTTPTSGMTDLGNNIWSIDVTFPSTAVDATLLYKFVNGNWGTNEGTDAANTIGAGGCGVDDGAGNVINPEGIMYRYDILDSGILGNGNSIPKENIIPDNKQILFKYTDYQFMYPGCSENVKSNRVYTGDFYGSIN